MDKWLIKPSTDSIRNTNQESSDVSTSSNIGSNERSSDAQSNSFTKKRGPGLNSILKITFNLASSRAMLTNQYV